jgi:hypothetical protein
VGCPARRVKRAREDIMTPPTPMKKTEALLWVQFRRYEAMRRAPSWVLGVDMVSSFEGRIWSGKLRWEMAQNAENGVIGRKNARKIRFCTIYSHKCKNYVKRISHNSVILYVSNFTQ